MSIGFSCSGSARGRRRRSATARRRALRASGPAAASALAPRCDAKMPATIAKRLRAVAIGDLSVRRDLPRLDRRCCDIASSSPRTLIELRQRRLLVAGVVGAARRDQRFAAVPLPREAEPRVRDRQHRRLQVGLAPGRTAVGGDLDASDRAAARSTRCRSTRRTPRPSSVSPPDGRVITDFASRSNVNCRAVPSGIRSVYFDVSSRRHRRLVHHLQPPQPLHVGVAFPAGQQQPQRIALLGPQRLAVLRVDDQRIVHHLLHRDAAIVLARRRRLRRAPRSRPAATPHSRSSVATGTPVHSLQLVSP